MDANARDKELRAAAIAASNDRYRRNLTDDFGTRCVVVCSQEVAHLPATVGSELLKAVAAFEHHGPENDPYGEHDFGKVTVDGVDYFWKFDYYADPDHTMGGDPYDPMAPLYRVLTIMAASEY